MRCLIYLRVGVPGILRPLASCTYRLPIHESYPERRQVHQVHGVAGELRATTGPALDLEGIVAACQVSQNSEPVALDQGVRVICQTRLSEVLVLSAMVNPD